MNKIKQAVLDTLWSYCDKGKELSLPIPIKGIIKSFPNIRLIPYSRVMRDRRISRDMMYKQAGSNDAYTDYYPNSRNYLVYYNDLDQSIINSNRYRWNLAHELGHVMLNHHANEKTRLFRNRLSNTEYRYMEDEADMFAAYILVPNVILNRIEPNIFSFQIKELCKISGQASQYRKENYDKWRRKNSKLDEYDLRLLELFSHKRVCNNCCITLQDKYRFCPTCGKRKIVKTYYNDSSERFSDIMKYPEFDNRSGKLTKCPICDNEEILTEAEYCHICGKRMINLCRNDTDNYDYYPIQCEMAENNPIPVNARYCPYCGSRTTFLEDGILKEWDYEVKEAINKYDNIPF